MSIVCASDFSEPSSAAANVAAALAQKLNCGLHLVHSVRDAVVAMPEAAIAWDPQEDARKRMEAEATRLRAAGATVTTEICQGRAEEEIVRVAEERQAIAVVLGSLGKNRAERWLLGSVAERVSESASRPTLVVRDEKPLLDWLRSGKELSLTCAVDATQTADAALEMVRTLMQLGACRITAAYVSWPFAERERLGIAFVGWPQGNPPETQAILERDITERVRGLLGAEAPVSVSVAWASGRPDTELLELADKSGPAQLIVVGTHQWHGLKRVARGSFSRGVLVHAATNVLCVPPSVLAAGRPAGKIRRVLVASDLSELSREALRQALRLLENGGVAHLLRVLPIASTRQSGQEHEGIATNSTVGKPLRDAAERELRQMAAEFSIPPGVTVEVEAVEHAEVVRGICQAAERCSADIICLGAQGHSRIGAALLGSVAQGVLAHTHRPVLAVPRPAK
jgi:nucleotide-binding universal stress UspA family protein